MRGRQTGYFCNIALGNAFACAGGFDPDPNSFVINVHFFTTPFNLICIHESADTTDDSFFNIYKYNFNYS